MVAKQEKEDEYRKHYLQLSVSISTAFQQLERTARMMNDNAARVLQEVVSKQPTLPSDADLLALAQALHVQSLDITDATGHFIRSPRIPLSEQKHSLFDYCADYRKLVSGESEKETTPIIPGYPDMGPRMFTMVPSRDRKYILESTVTLDFISEILESALRHDPNVATLGLFTPNGKKLGNVSHGNLTGDLHIRQSVPAGVTDCCECKFKGVASERQGLYSYFLEMTVSTDALNSHIVVLRKRCLLAASAVLVTTAAFAVLLGRRLARRIVSISRTAKSILDRDDMSLRVESAGTQDEVRDLADTINAMLAGLQNSRQRALEHKRLETMASVAGQVAHDIRSPLTALNTVLKNTRDLPEDARVLARTAIHRVQDIANELLMRRQGAEKLSCDIFLLFPLIESLVSEKRVELRSRLNLDLRVAAQPSGVTAFAKISPAKIKRVLSNLINNSAEAVGSTGTIIVSVTSDGSEVSVDVCDDGPGIPEEILAKLGREAVTHGKVGGHGIGVSSAAESMAQMGGSLSYESTVGHGTRAMLRLPQRKPPCWFLETLDLRNRKKVVIVDDDQSIHGVWRDRIGKGSRKNIDLVHFSSPQELRIWISKNPIFSDYFFLIDFEFVGHTESGLEVIEAIGLQGCAVLVTSRFDESKILQRCITSSVRLLPKSVAAYIPIDFNLIADPDAVLIDDDPMVHTLWAMNAREKDKRLLTFTSVSDFMQHQAKLPRETPVYIDSELGDGERGEVSSKKIAALGFAEIYLATGHAPSNFNSMPWIRQVRDKCGPF